MVNTESDWLDRLVSEDPALAEKVRLYLTTRDPVYALSHAEYVRATGIAGPTLPAETA